MQNHKLTQPTQPPANVRRVAVIRTDGRRFHIQTRPTPQEIPMRLFTIPTLKLNDFADGGGQVLASYPAC